MMEPACDTEMRNPQRRFVLDGEFLIAIIFPEVARFVDDLREHYVTALS